MLLVCDAGIGTSNLLMAKVTSMYEVNVVDIVTYDQLENALAKHQADYILSTAQISHDRVPVIKVSPLISERDKVLLNPHFQPKFTRQLDFDQLSKRWLIAAHEYHGMELAHQRFATSL